MFVTLENLNTLLIKYLHDEEINIKIIGFEFGKIKFLNFIYRSVTFYCSKKIIDKHRKHYIIRYLQLNAQTIHYILKLSHKRSK